MRVQCIHHTGHAANHQGLGMGVLSAEDGLHLGRHFGYLKGIQIMGDNYQVGLRWKLVGRISPVCIRKRSEAA